MVPQALALSSALPAERPFADTSAAANATLIANGLDFGSAIFFGDSMGGTARVEVFAGNSTMAT
jgi:hypothetical protein